jgi:hypothetical protein
MTKAAIHLLRCKAEPLPQGDAFAVQRSAISVLESSFLERPTARVKRGATWHIGNTRRTREGVLSFALGRDAVLRAQQFDEGAREFQEIEQRHAPFTFGVFDPKSQTVGVLIRQGVSLNAKEVADKIEALLESTGIARQANRRISVDFIPDPTGFIDTIRSAYRVTRFEFSFTVPNPPDDEKYIQRPLKDFAKRADATEGKASIRGDRLNAEELVEVASAVAATGDDATANVQMTQGAPILKKRLGANSLREPVEGEGEDAIASVILEAMRRAYDFVRKADGRAD